MNKMIQCRYYEQSYIQHSTIGGKDYVERGMCRLGNEIPLGGCLTDCPDYEPIT